jgi:hypothetical protein
MIKMIPHNEGSCKRGGCQILCREVRNPLVLKTSHTVKACVSSNHVKFQCIQTHFEEILTLAPFTAYHAASADDIGDGCVGRRSMTFQYSFKKKNVDGKEE